MKESAMYAKIVVGLKKISAMSAVRPDCSMADAMGRTSRLYLMNSVALSKCQLRFIVLTTSRNRHRLRGAFAFGHIENCGRVFGNK